MLSGGYEMRMKRVCSILLMTAVLLCLLSVGVSAEETMATHSHPICGSRCCCGSSHSSNTWTAWDGTTRMYNGYYYLTKDVVLSNTMILDYSYTSYLCLNGHTITCDSMVFDIYSYRSLLISDCVGTGTITSTGNCTISNNKYLSVWGGTITNSGSGAAVYSYNNTTTYVCGGTVKAENYCGIYAYPGSRIYVQGGNVQGGSNYSAAIDGHDIEGGTQHSQLTVSGGRITTTNGRDALSVQCGNFTMSGGYVGGNVVVYDSDAVVNVSGGTVDGCLFSTGMSTTITGGDMELETWDDEITVYAGKFRGECTFLAGNATVLGGDFSECEAVYVNKKTWISGGSFDTVRVNEGPLYLSGIPDINTLQLSAPGKVSAQSPDGTASFGGDPIGLQLTIPYSETVWRDGNILIKDVKSNAAAQKFFITGEDAQWNYPERSGNNLVLRILPHGTWGDATWSLIDGVLRISGTGALKGTHSGHEYPWGDYLDQITSIVVEPGITAIPNYAFEYCEYATTITLPDTLTDLSLHAFQDCASLNNLLLPGSLVSITGNSNSGHPDFIRCGALSDLYYMGTAEELASIARTGQVVNSYCDMTIHCLQLLGTPATCTEPGLQLHYRFEEPSCYGGLYDLDKKPITQPQVLPALGHRKVVEAEIMVDPITVENTDTVPFEKRNGAYFSANHDSSSASSLRISASAAVTLKLYCGVSSESNYDKMEVLHNGTQVLLISGEVSNRLVTLPLAAGDVVTVRYFKDGSVNRGEDRCWFTMEYDNVPAFGGKDVPAESFDPDCTNPVTCDYCGTVVKAALGHDTVYHPGKAPTCTEAGWADYETCNRCEHTTYSPLTELGHDYHEINAREPGCTEPGWELHQACSRCDSKIGYMEIPALNHDPIPHEGQAPTCTEPGWEPYETCSRCDHSTFTQIPELGHHLLFRRGEAPSCTEPGWEDHEFCNRCDYTTYVEIPKTGHSPVKDEAVAPTCIHEGLTEGSHCGTCGQVLVAQKPVEPTGEHSYVDGKCEHCGKQEWKTGDLTHDGNVDEGDVEALLWHILFPESYPLEEFPDYNHDGTVDEGDVETLLWHVLFPEMHPLRKPEKPDDLS